ncbi:hypothetical protein GCM10025771_10870 [Niveibacterium umoris]|uniref:GNAT superfamily N-acetyltransferase n=1 Tax=Niveibacterium umoris TaxID=1193620 RepID=A0A840BNX6_9RHOO|nr:GNAT family N-acetyltransferase [Niveibacterium umoris]MBB4013362.1 GNAT superfamily N-acetyltransferase [Niveibacterium umoris]
MATSPSSKPTASPLDETLIDEILALDLLTLKAHTEQAGDRIDAAPHRARLCEILPVSRLSPVRRDGRLVAYGMVTQHAYATWIVTAFNIHPAHRTAGVMRQMLAGMAALIESLGLDEICSHVYKANAASVRFHTALGFAINRENDKAYEFVAPVGYLLGGARADRLLRRAVAI